MSLLILDTDHASLFLKGNTLVCDRIFQTEPDDLAISVITAEEICQGWLSEINKYSQANQSSRLLLAYSEFEKSLDFFQTIQRLSFDTNAYNQFEILRHQFRRLGTRDLRIAAIALSLNATVITRNAKDFGQIPNLSIEDWS
ncbi:MAG: type II toxin-antitoxin system VapC family toxin [Pseudanabaena sp. Salubria-1]|uniref:type II toxin-antitoxin system VapC family toxin n=1 Tax=Pseudanabaena sp. BC1403 TaxID=2043171 RepID=UPI0011AF9011|nr:type II toxin-antitoxin system VapC family toxin [Pseudanabaena sp. BC1403]MCL1490160.1 type II toxin-antitoxin system VapC family toxin [Pseudanabaena sp. Salubria-1]